MTFYNPVPVHIAPDYYDIVKKPMHLKLIKQKLEKGEYGDERQFKQVCSVDCVVITLQATLVNPKLVSLDVR